VSNLLPGEFLYLDESGDLGGSPNSTPVFVVAILHLRGRHVLSRVIKRARRKVLGRRTSKSELKWSNSNDALRRRVIGEIGRERAQVVGVSAAVIQKSWIDARLASRREEIRYNYAVRFAMEKGGLFDESAEGKRILLTIDARNRRATSRLREYIELFMENGDLRCSVQIDAADSAHLPQLQATDFVAGSIYAAYAHGQWSYLNQLRSAGIDMKLRVPKKIKPAP